LASAYSVSCLTFAFMFSKSGLKNEIIRAGGRSIELAPLYLIW
jgi:hypothetical protein